MNTKYPVMRPRHLAVSTILAGGLVIALPAAAQQAAPATAAKAADPNKPKAKGPPVEVPETELPAINVRDSIGKAGDNNGFATVTVASGTRTGTPITSIPRSIGIVSHDVIVTQQDQTVGDALRNIAGVSVVESGGAQGIYVRGYLATNSLTNGFLENGLVNRPLGSVERLEVLKGPASILVGTQPAGGVVNTILKKPTDTPLRSVSLSGGSNGFVDGLIDVGGPLTRDGKLGFRLNLEATRSDHNFGGYDGVRKYLIAPVVAVHLGAFDVTVGGEFFHTRTPSSPATAAFPLFPPFTGTTSAQLTAYQAANRNIFAAPLAISPQVIGNATDGTSIDSLRGYFEASLKIVKSEGFDLTLRSRGQSASTTTLSNGYIAFIVDNSTKSLLAGYNGSAVKVRVSNDGIQNDLVAKFGTGPIQHTVLAGFDYSRQERNQFNGQSYTTPLNFTTFTYNDPFPNFSRAALGGPYTQFANTTLDQTGVLLQDQMDIFDRLHVLLATRFNKFITNSETFRPTAIVRSHAEFRKQGYNVGLTYDVTDWMTPYASYSRGFQPSIGGVSRGPDGVTGIPLPPEESNQYEVGVKSLLLDDRLSITASAFVIATTNTPFPAPRVAGDTMGYSIAGAGQHSRGVEVELAGAITPSWNLLVTGTYQKVRGVQASQGAGANYDVTVAVPKYTGNLWMTYTVPNGAARGLGIGLGEYVVSETFGANLRVPPYALTKFTVFYNGFQHFRLNATLENAFDKRYYTFAQVNSYVPIGSPRTFLLTATAKY